DTSQVVLMLVMLLIGAVMSWLLGSYVRIRIRRQLKEK
ncbi:MAG: LapA family protein, partial [Deltaproteobacteria bacterium]|nr:LapA family protein [Deltaproteobacteria bacterium]